MPKFYIKISRKTFFPNFRGGGGTCPPCPRLLRLCAYVVVHSSVQSHPTLHVESGQRDAARQLHRVRRRLADARTIQRVLRLHQRSSQDARRDTPRRPALHSAISAPCGKVLCARVWRAIFERFRP